MPAVSYSPTSSMPLPSDDPQGERCASQSDAPQENLARKILRFEELALCGDEIWIEYQGKLYRLQSTRQGKLVLTK
ncbi:hemin uptake protein HemP [Rubripirellula amarantea]|nr:hemin uptake protein HemP [Rubripirellula amarantea]